MPVQSVNRAVSILDAYSIDEPWLGVTQLANKLGLDKSTVHRLLVSLLQGGLIEQDPRSRKYRLGIRLLELGNVVLGSRKLPELALPYLRYLSDTVEEMTYLAAQSGDAMLTVFQVPSPHLLQWTTWIGRGPLHCTCTGKVFLAHMSEDELESLLEKGLARRTAKTVCDPTELRAELERVREEGFATAFEEYKEGENAVGVPITKPDDTVIAAIGVVGPSYRFTREKLMGSLDVIRGVGAEISRRIRELPPEVIDLS